MYNQVTISVYDRDALRFLWYKDAELVCMRMCVIIFGGIWLSYSSTHALRKMIADNPDIDPLLKEPIVKAM